MGKSEQTHKQQVAHLEECLRQEIFRYEQVSAELIAVRGHALDRLEAQEGKSAATEIKRQAVPAGNCVGQDAQRGRKTDGR